MVRIYVVLLLLCEGFFYYVDSYKISNIVFNNNEHIFKKYVGIVTPEGSEQVTFTEPSNVFLTTPTTTLITSISTTNAAAPVITTLPSITTTPVSITTTPTTTTSATTSTTTLATTSTTSATTPTTTSATTSTTTSSTTTGIPTTPVVLTTPITPQTTISTVGTPITPVLSTGNPKIEKLNSSNAENNRNRGANEREELGIENRGNSNNKGPPFVPPGLAKRTFNSSESFSIIISILTNGYMTPASVDVVEEIDEGIDLRMSDPSERDTLSTKRNGQPKVRKLEIRGLRKGLRNLRTYSQCYNNGRNNKKRWTTRAPTTTMATTIPTLSTLPSTITIATTTMTIPTTTVTIPITTMTTPTTITIPTTPMTIPTTTMTIPPTIMTIPTTPMTVPTTTMTIPTTTVTIPTIDPRGVSTSPGPIRQIDNSVEVIEITN